MLLSQWRGVQAEVSDHLTRLVKSPHLTVWAAGLIQLQGTYLLCTRTGMVALGNNTTQAFAKQTSLSYSLQ